MRTDKKMSKEEYEREYGRTKLDHVLSHICKAFEKILEFCAIAFVPLLIVEQLSIYGVTHADQVISLLFVLMLIISAYGVKLFRDWRKED